MLIFDDSLASGWASWSWSGDFDFAATDLVHSGAASISADVEGYGAVSLHSDVTFSAAALTMWVEGEGTDLTVMLEADGEGYSTAPIDLPNGISEGTWTEVTVDLTGLGSHAWTRIDVFVNNGTGARFHLDDIALSDEVPADDTWTAAEPLTGTTMMLYGAGDTADLALRADGVALTLASSEVLSDPARLRTTWSSDFSGADRLELTAGGTTFTRALWHPTVTVGEVRGEVSPDIYGMAFPTNESFLDNRFVTVARWGGNATSLYNPAVGVTNLANDWYFENYASDDAVAWMDGLNPAAAFLSVPALDWVAKDDTSCAYPVSVFGPQTSTDPWRTDCGSGTLTDGTEITWNDPADHATPWTPEMAAAWVADLTPTYIAIDNELDIASSTHRDVHPDPVTYEELFTRWSSFADAIRVVQPDAQIAGPASCCWWFYWNSEAGDADKAAHGEDFLPWWLDQIAAHDAETGVRTLDLFDVHYYPDGVFNDDTDDATQAHRLRATRSLWDPTYTDEGWIGADEWATLDQPSPNEVQLIPRMKALIDAHYPGTRFGITEWNFGAEEDLSGGLAVADVLGIFGREGVDVATYWTAPPEGSPAELAFALYQGATGDAVEVIVDDPDRLGVYRIVGTTSTRVIVVNKDPDHDAVLSADDWNEVVHFGPAAIAGVSDGDLSGTLIVPAYSAMAMFVDVGGADPGDTGDTATEDSGSADDSDDIASDTAGEVNDKVGDVACGCATSGTPGALGLVAALGALVRRGSRRRRDMLPLR